MRVSKQSEQMRKKALPEHKKPAHREMRIFEPETPEFMEHYAGNAFVQRLASQNRSPMLQRKCACGGNADHDGECAECRRKRLALHNAASPIWPAPLRLQAKLTVNQPGDIYEREADRVAGQIMRTPAQRLQRCACGGVAGPSGECEQCRAKRLGLQRSSIAAITPTEAPDSVYRTLHSPGQPLDASTREFMESRFGTNFNNVRVHTDSQAAQSATEVNARAYTVGQDVVFGAGQYGPETKGGKWLLAHELTHVVQQRRIIEPVVRREAGSTTMEFVMPPNICSPQQTREIAPAVATAQRWLQTADTQITGYLGAIGTSAQRTNPAQSTEHSLVRHFADSTPDTARYVQNQIRLIADRLRTDAGAPSPLTVQCHGTLDTTCTGDAAAYVQGSMLVFCPSFFGSDAAWGVMAMIHEIAHSLPMATGSLHITDRAYRSDRLYGSLTPGEALTNAESYAMFVREIATGPIGSNAPRDTYEDCSADWRGALSIAIALAQRWNRDAQVVLHDSRPTFLAGWQNLAAIRLGGQSPAQIAAAQSVYDQAQTRLGSKVDFECEPKGGGRCNASMTYWYALGDFHICPSWRTLPTNEDRAEALLAGLYGYFDIVDDNQRRWNLTRLARALHFQWWSPPSAAVVSGGLIGTRAGPRPPAAPGPGPMPIP